MEGNRRSTGRMIVELGVIFSGVLGAFVAEDLRQNREDDQRAQQIYVALLGELQTFTVRAPVVVDDMTTRIEGWESAVAQGQRPPPPYYREPGGETPPTAIWQATLASGGVSLLDPRLFNLLAQFYNRLESTSNRYLRYNGRTEELILPRASEDPAVFYSPDGALRGDYRAHVELLAEIRDELVSLSDEGVQVADSVSEWIR